MVFTPRSERTASTSIMSTSAITGTRSLNGSTFLGTSWGTKALVVICELEKAPNTPESPADLATNSRAMLPAAPGLFSTSTVAAVAPFSPSVVVRAMKSATPPAG